MIAIVVLVLALLGPGNVPRNVAAYPMASATECHAAALTFLRSAPPLGRGEEPHEFRSATCLAVPVQGKDA